MSRNRASAKKAGTQFETDVADYLAKHVDPVIERRTKNGNKDRGDISGLRHLGHRVVIECKNVKTMALSSWVKQAHLEAGNDDALVGVVVHKRHGTSAPGEQWVTMTLADFAALLTGERVEP